MDLKEAIYTRRSIREFTAEPVDKKTIRDLIDAAIQAPSAVKNRASGIPARGSHLGVCDGKAHLRPRMKAQPCAFRVVRDKTVLDTISGEAKAHMLKTTPVGLMTHHFNEILNDPNFDIFYHAPALILISTATDIPWAVEDCALAAENLMLAARGAGLGTCWIGFAQAWLGTPEGKTLLQLPAAYRPVAPIIVGHPKSAAPPVPRKEPEIRWVGA
jgi:nitroreductase